MAETETETRTGNGPRTPGWAKVILLTVTGLTLVAAIGFGIGIVIRPADSGPHLDREEAFAEAKARTEEEVQSKMARRGFEQGKRVGRRHGILAGGMAAESDAFTSLRERWAAEAQADAAAAQSELAGMTAAPAPPSPTGD